MAHPRTLHHEPTLGRLSRQMLAISVGVVPPQRGVELWGYLVSVMCGACLYGFFVASLTVLHRTAPFAVHMKHRWSGISSHLVGFP